MANENNSKNVNEAPPTYRMTGLGPNPPGPSTGQHNQSTRPLGERNTNQTTGSAVRVRENTETQDRKAQEEEPYRAPSPPPPSAQHTTTDAKARAKQREDICLNSVFARSKLDAAALLTNPEEVYWAGGIIQVGNKYSTRASEVEMNTLKTKVWRWVLRVPDDVHELSQVL